MLSDATSPSDLFDHRDTAGVYPIFGVIGGLLARIAVQKPLWQSLSAGQDTRSVLTIRSHRLHQNNPSVTWGRLRMVDRRWG